jgi:hypothetical protein
MEQPEGTQEHGKIGQSAIIKSVKIGQSVIINGWMFYCDIGRYANFHFSFVESWYLIE